jgi:hypothetical protein
MIEKIQNDLSADGHKEMSKEHDEFAIMSEKTYEEVVPDW